MAALAVTVRAPGRGSTSTDSHLPAGTWEGGEDGGGAARTFGARKLQRKTNSDRTESFWHGSVYLDFQLKLLFQWPWSALDMST